MACSWRAANDDHDRFRRNRQARSANRDIMSVSEPEGGVIMHRKPSMLKRISYALFCNRKCNSKIVRLKRNWDEVVHFTCGSGNRKG